MSRRDPSSTKGLGTRAAVLGVVAGLAALALGGCSHDYWVRLVILSDADPLVVATDEMVQIPLGQAVAVRAIPMQDEERMDADVQIELESQQPSVLGLDEGIEQREFIIYGASAGQTAIDVYFGGDWVAAIPATVREAD
jgi:hypothetical protein